MARTLLRALLPGLAGALLAGCVTGYDYRGGSGDYYYGQPEVEYRDQGWYGAPYGYYGSGYYGSGYYGYGPYSGYYGGYPYGYWDPYWIRTRPPRHHHDGDHGHDHDHDQDDNPPSTPTTFPPPPRPRIPQPPRDRGGDDGDARGPGLPPPHPQVMPPHPQVLAPRRVESATPFVPREPRDSRERDGRRKTLP